MPGWAIFLDLPALEQCSFTVTKKIVLGCIRMYFLLQKATNPTTSEQYYLLNPLCRDMGALETTLHDSLRKGTAGGSYCLCIYIHTCIGEPVHTRDTLSRR